MNFTVFEWEARANKSARMHLQHRGKLINFFFFFPFSTLVVMICLSKKNCFYVCLVWHFLSLSRLAFMFGLSGFEDLINGNCSFKQSNYCLEQSLLSVPQMAFSLEKTPTNFGFVYFPGFVSSIQPIIFVYIEQWDYCYLEMNFWERLCSIVEIMAFGSGIQKESGACQELSVQDYFKCRQNHPVLKNFHRKFGPWVMIVILNNLDVVWEWLVVTEILKFCTMMFHEMFMSSC